MNVLDRMTAALTDLDQRWKGKRRPKAFYLLADDWAEFMATDPQTIQTMFGNNPPTLVTDPAFKGVPVRESDGKIASRLYDNTSMGRSL